MKILLCPDGFYQHSPCCVIVDSRRVESHLFVPDKGMLLLLGFLFYFFNFQEDLSNFFV